MILVDTSVWIDHLRVGSLELAETLNSGDVLTHPFVVGEIACGGLENRAEILALLDSLPTAELATHSEVLEFVARRNLFATGLGWIDMHLLASTILSNCAMMTFDRALVRQAKKLGVAA